MATWKDTTMHSRGAIDTTPRVWKIVLGFVVLTVLRHRDYPGTWVVQSDATGHWPRDLQTDDIDEAKQVALDIVYTALRVAIEAAEAARQP